MNIFQNKIFKKENEHLLFDSKNLTKLAKQYGTPLYVFSEREIRKNVNEVIATFRTFYEKTNIHYSAQCEATLANLQVIRNSGCDLEVNSGGELFKGLQAGFEGNQIIFNGVDKTIDEIEFAIKSGVKAINVDSIYELTMIIKISQSLEIPVNISLMIAPETSNSDLDLKENVERKAEFGITFEQLRTAIRISQRSKKYINLIGYHFCIGSKDVNFEEVSQRFRYMLESAIKMYQLTSFRPKSLNIGGGITSDNMIKIADAISKELNVATIENWAGKEFCEFFNNIELIVEPGRIITSSAGILLTNIVNEKYRKNLNENWLTIDIGLNSGLEIQEKPKEYQLLCANKINEYHIMPYKLSNLFYKSAEYIRFPNSITVGDIVAILNAGAYSTVNMSNYNGRPMPGILLIKKNGTIKQIKKSRNYNDLLEGEEPFNDKINLCVV